MKLAAIYNVWDREEHLKQSIEYILEDVDIIIIVWQNVSNFQENYMPNLVPIEKLKSDKIRYIQYNPDFRYTDIDVGYKNEQQKRQLGVDIAKISGASHFLLLDTDEFYPDFKELKEEFIESGADGSAVEIETYIYRTDYRVTPPMKYHVPFICELKRTTILGGHFQFKVDQTRSTSLTECVLLSKPMHHMSWVRNNIERKLRNSSARHTRRNQVIVDDIERLKAYGLPYKCKYFNKDITDDRT